MLGVCVGNLQVLWGLLGRAWSILGLYLGNLQVSWGLLDLWVVCWQPSSLLGPVRLRLKHLGGVCWQPTGLMGPVGPSLVHLGRACDILGLYVGNLQVFWGLLDWAWGILGCMLTYRSWGSVGRSLGLYVGKQVLWGLLDRAWGILGCMSASLVQETLRWVWKVVKEQKFQWVYVLLDWGELLAIHMLQTSSCYSDDCSHWWCQGFLMTCPCTNLHVRSWVIMSSFSPVFTWAPGQSIEGFWCLQPCAATVCPCFHCTQLAIGDYGPQGRKCWESVPLRILWLRHARSQNI